MRTALLKMGLLAVLFSSATTSNTKSLKLNMTKKSGRVPMKNYGVPKPNVFYQTSAEIQRYLAGFARATTSIEVNVDNMDSYYATDIYLGSAKQAFNVLVDTGSNILVI